MPLSCAFIGTYDFELWATDQNGNQAKCNSIVILNDSEAYCELLEPNPLYSIAGYIQDENGEMIAGVNVEINNESTEMETTDIAGDYLFSNLEMGNNFTISPSKDINLLNGVTTLDLAVSYTHLTLPTIYSV